MEENKPPTKKALNRKLCRLRGEQATMLKLKGHTYEAILKKINDEAEAKQWGVITMSQLKKDISKYTNFHLDYNTGELQEILNAEKLVYEAEVDRNYAMIYSLLMASIHYYQNEDEMKVQHTKKPVISKGQIPTMLDLLNRTGDHLSRIKGWDSSAKINIFNNTIQNNELNIYDRAKDEAKTITPTVACELTTLLRDCRFENKESNGLELASGVVDRDNADREQKVDIPKS